MVAIQYADLLAAFEFVSFDAEFESRAYICVDTGAIVYVSDFLELEEGVPEDLETSNRYVAVPHKHDLNLGQNLALTFAAQELPGDYDSVVEFFRHKGAYSRFKKLLESRSLRDVWFAFEARAIEAELRSWCNESGIQLLGPVE